MQLRVYIIDPNQTIRQFIAQHIESLGHQAITARSADNCLRDPNAPPGCCREQLCGDAIILGQEVPIDKGLAFIERRQQQGCTGAARHSAIIFRPLSPLTRQLADTVGCHHLEATALLDNITAWLEQVAAQRPTDRQLAPLPSGD